MNKILMIAGAVAVSACADAPKHAGNTSVVLPASVSDNGYSGLNCVELAEERDWVVTALLVPGKKAAAAQATDVKDVVLVDRGGKVTTSEDVAELKGQLLAIDTTMLQKRCQKS